MQSHTQIAMLMVLVSLSPFLIIPLWQHVTVVKERRELDRKLLETELLVAGNKKYSGIDLAIIARDYAYVYSDPEETDGRISAQYICQMPDCCCFRVKIDIASVEIPTGIHVQCLSKREVGYLLSKSPFLKN
ncbi:hypothetical protein ACO0K7_08405 [Undibacterium sp. Ji67W]|uniref:hypothetical protein n=1 Tax=Undibacterium sp. Ji67W TaxID=3413042 RepID=UPI003BF05F9C